MNTFWTVLLIVLGVCIVILAVVYFLGRRMQSQQGDSQALMEASKQTVSMLVIDKKKMKLGDAGLPKVVMDSIDSQGGVQKVAAKFMKYPVVKAKVGPKVVTLLADPTVFEILPVKAECKVSISGIYITELKSVRGQAVPKAPEKKGIKKFAEKLRDKASKAQSK